MCMDGLPACLHREDLIRGRDIETLDWKTRCSASSSVFQCPKLSLISVEQTLRRNPHLKRGIAMAIA